MEPVKNVLKNSVAPIYRSMETATGFTMDVALEVTITWVLRYFIGMKVTLWELFFTSLLAAPLISAGAMITLGTGSAQAWPTRFLSGLQSVPAYFLAQYIIGTSSKGFYVPKINIWNVLITIIARVSSKVIIQVLMDKVNVPGKSSWNEFDTFTQRAVKAGRFAK